MLDALGWAGSATPEHRTVKKCDSVPKPPERLLARLARKRRVRIAIVVAGPLKEEKLGSLSSEQ